MRIYTYSEARQRLASLLDEAKGTGEVRIRRNDGSVFRLTPVVVQDSPFGNIKGIRSAVDRKEIVDIVREGREG